jgi:biotin carboxyl carrier protein
VIESELDGERHRVAPRREGDRWIAGIAGREVTVSVAEAGGEWSMLIGPPVLPPEGGSHETLSGSVASGFLTAGASAEAVSRKSYRVSFEGDLIVRVDGIAVPLTILRAVNRGGRRGGEAGGDRGPRPLVAPMAGRVVKVLVKTGEAVAARQPLVVVEAMKMENELRAPRDGTVAEVRVSEGSSVEANAVLVVLSDVSRSA